MTRISYDAQGRENDAQVRVAKVINMPFGGGKEKGREKETFPPAPPIEKKLSQKKQARYFLLSGFSKPARAHARVRKGRLPCTCSYAEAGVAAHEIIGNCFGNMSDLRLWAWYCRHFNRERIVEKAYEYASRYRQYELREAITAFQAWLSKEYRNPPKHLYAHSSAADVAKDWALCRESGCRHCSGNGCSRGIALPPNHHLNAHPCRPEECPAFSAKGGVA